MLQLVTKLRQRVSWSNFWSLFPFQYQVNGLNNAEYAQIKNLSKHKYRGHFLDSEIRFKVIFLSECLY